MSCGRCSSNPCSCGPAPYYTQSRMCPEDSTIQVNNYRYLFGMCPTNNWNVPAVGFTAILNVPGALGVAVGSYIWNENYGYFLINSIDVSAGTITIVNTGITGNAAPGTQVSPCTCFTVTDPPVDLVNTSCNFVAIDFTAPDVSDCIDITLTGVAGLIAGNNVQIGSGIYSLSEIKANYIVTICNDGEGLPAGTAVIAKNTVTGEFNYCVSLLGVTPCNQDPVEEGIVVICDGDSTKTLTGTNINYVLTLNDVATGDASYKDSGVAALAAVVAALTITVNNLGAALGQKTQFGYTTNYTNVIVAHVNSGLTTYTGPVVSITVANFPTYSRLAIGTVDATMSVYATNANANDLVVLWTFQIQVDGGGYTDLPGTYTGTLVSAKGDGATTHFTYDLHAGFWKSWATGSAHTVDIRPTAIWVGDGTGRLDIVGADINFNMSGVVI